VRWFRSNKDAATEPVERARRCDMSVYSRHESIQAVTVDLTSRRRPRPGTSATGLAGPPGWAGKAPPPPCRGHGEGFVTGTGVLGRSWSSRRES